MFIIRLRVIGFIEIGIHLFIIQFLFFGHLF